MEKNTRPASVRAGNRKTLKVEICLIELKEFHIRIDQAPGNVLRRYGDDGWIVNCVLPCEAAQHGNRGAVGVLQITSNAATDGNCSRARGAFPQESAGCGFELMPASAPSVLAGTPLAR